MKKTAAHPDLAIVAALAKHLLSPSTTYEDAARLRKLAMQDGLRCLATLDKPTRLSLPIHPAAPASGAQPASHASSRASSPASGVTTVVPPPEPRFGSHKAEYQAALENPSVVDALLEYQARKLPPGSAQSPLSAFRTQPLAQVSAEPRPGARRIFRPRGD